jgi:phosphomannomutase
MESPFGDIVHLRASGNAPECRCYTESDSAKEAKSLCAYWMELLVAWKEHG